MPSLPIKVKGGVLGAHDAIKRTVEQAKREADKAVLDRVKARKPKKHFAVLTAQEKKEALDAMLEEWLLS